MASTYPTTLDSFINPIGTNTQDNPDHAGQHANINDSMVQVQKTLGTTAGTSVLKNFASGDFAARINGETLGTPTIGTITVPGTTTALGFSASIAPGVGTLTDSAGGTLTVNAQAGQVFYSAMGTSAGNRTLAAPLNPTGYQTLTYAFKASGSANGTLVWNAIFRFSQDSGTPALGTGTTWNYYGWRYNPIDTKWDFQGQSKNIV